MGTDTTMIALDSNAMTYWIEAMGSVSNSPAEPCSDEKTALVRIFFWMPDESGFHLTPTVEAEYQAIRDKAKLDDHVSWALSLLCPVRPLPDETEVSSRTLELQQRHKGANDCKIVAECELTEIQTLLTCDPRLIKNLCGLAKHVQLLRPTVYWEKMSVPKGRRPLRIPHQTNPMSRCGWWRW